MTLKEFEDIYNDFIHHGDTYIATESDKALAAFFKAKERLDEAFNRLTYSAVWI